MQVNSQEIKHFINSTTIDIDNKQNIFSPVELVIIESIYKYIFPVICLYGISVNTINAIIFSHKYYKPFGKLSEYLKINSIVIVIGYIFSFFTCFSRYSTTYWGKFYHLYGYILFFNTAFLLSTFIHLSIAFYQYLIITKRCLILNDLSVKYALIISFVMSIIFVSPLILSRRIEKSTKHYVFMNQSYSHTEYILNLHPIKKK